MSFLTLSYHLLYEINFCLLFDQKQIPFGAIIYCKTFTLFSFVFFQLNVQDERIDFNCHIKYTAVVTLVPTRGAVRSDSGVVPFVQEINI